MDFEGFTKRGEPSFLDFVPSKDLEARGMPRCFGIPSQCSSRARRTAQPRLQAGEGVGER